MAESKSIILETPKATVQVKSYVSAGEVESYALDAGIGTFSSYRSLVTTRERLIEHAAEPGANLCLAINGGDTIVGFCIRRPAPRDERWARMDPPVLYEVLGENSRGWRDQKLMHPMLRLIVEENANEDRILYIVGYSWTWDLDETKKSIPEYRDTIIHLLQPLGFKQLPTNEPNISLRPENLFMARIGERIEKKIKRRFTNLLFGITDD